MKSFLIPELQAFLRYVDLPGSAPAYVYLAGGGFSAYACFAAVAARAELANHRSIFVDLLGAGYSDHPYQFAYGLDDHAHTVGMLLDALEINHCVVIGASLGGAVAVVLAARRPFLVGQLVLLEANLDPADGMLSRSVAAQTEAEFLAGGRDDLIKFFHDRGLAGDASAAAIAGMWQVASPHALYRSLVALAQGASPTMRQQLYRLTIPCAYIWGEQSLPDPNWDALSAQEIHTLIVPAAGHGMMLDNPSGTAAAILAALAKFRQ